MFVRAKNRYQQDLIDRNVSEIQTAVERSYLGDEMLIANRNMSFYDDARFTDLLNEVATAPIYQEMAWRLHVLCWAAEHALKHDGAFMELGVFRGFKSYFLLRYFGERLSEREFYLCDTFEGIDPSLADGSPVDPDEHGKRFLYEFVTSRFAEFGNVNIVKGSVPRSLESVECEKVSFLHLDMNSYQAEIGGLEYLWDRLHPGSMIVLDDFGLFSHRSQILHELPWFEGRSQTVLELPTGQGLVIRT